MIRRLLSYAPLLFACLIIGCTSSPVTVVPADTTLSQIATSQCIAALRDTVELLSDDVMTGRGPGTPGAALAQAYLSEQFQNLRLTPLKNNRWTQPVHIPARANASPTQDTVMQNVLAVLPGRGELANEFVVLSAHYDHLGTRTKNGNTVIYPGADDNASGVAVMLEVAMRLVAQFTDDPASRRTLLVVAFAGEERGLLGSMQLIRQAPSLLPSESRIATAINLDMVGRLRHDRLYIAGKDEKLIAQIRRQSRKQNLRTETFIPGLALSDHVPFKQANIPAITLFTGWHNDYHQPTDTAEKLNYQGMARIVALMTNVLTDQLQANTTTK